MADLEELQRRFKRYKIISQPAPGCDCNNGVRKGKDDRESPCLCVCMTAPEPGQPEYRIEMRLALVRAMKGFLDDMKVAKS